MFFDLTAHVILALREKGRRVDPLQPPIAQLARRGYETRIVLRFDARRFFLLRFLRLFFR